jgi:hypothetical protein
VPKINRTGPVDWTNTTPVPPLIERIKLHDAQARLAIGMDNEPPDGANGEKQAGGDAATFSNVIDFLFEVDKEFRTQNIKTPAAVKIRDEVRNEIIHAIELLEQ